LISIFRILAVYSPKLKVLPNFHPVVVFFQLCNFLSEAGKSLTGWLRSSIVVDAIESPGAVEVPPCDEKIAWVAFGICFRNWRRNRSWG
jgi:hypothetical protein